MTVTGITYKDFPRDLKDRMTYLCEARSQVVKAFDVARQLDDWIGNNFQTHYPLAAVEASAATLVVSIGDVCVWCSETHNSEELTFEKCVEQYRQYVSELNEVFTDKS